MFFLFLIILILGIWAGLNFWSQSNGFLPALFAPIVIALIVDGVIWLVFVKWLQWAVL